MVSLEAQQHAQSLDRAFGAGFRGDDRFRSLLSGDGDAESSELAVSYYEGSVERWRNARRAMRGLRPIGIRDATGALPAVVRGPAYTPRSRPIGPRRKKCNTRR